MQLRHQAVLALIALWAVAHPPAAAQSVRGNVSAAEGGRALPGARLLLLTVAGEPVDSTVTGPDGRYRLSAPAPGEYVVYFAMDGWAGFPSAPLALAAGATSEFEFRVQLVSNEALRDMGEIMGLEPRLQASLPELCGEAFRPWEAGLLVGRVRAQGTGERLAGVRVSAHPASGDVRATISTEHGVYVLCNVPAGTGVQVVTSSPGGVTDTTRVEVRAGTVGWYDLFVRRPRR